MKALKSIIYMVLLAVIGYCVHKETGPITAGLMVCFAIYTDMHTKNHARVKRNIDTALEALKRIETLFKPGHVETNGGPVVYTPETVARRDH